MHLLTTNDVHVQMRHRLATIRAAVHDNTEATFGNSIDFGDFAGYSEQVAKQRFFGLYCIVDRDNMLVREYQYMGRRNRMEIADGSDLFVSIDDGSRYFAGYDLAEEAGLCGHKVFGMNWK